MNKRHINIPRLIFLVVTIAAAIVIFSSTIGKDWYEGRDQSIQSFAIVHFAGYLFFLLMPVELAFAYCSANHGETGLIITLALGTAVVAQTIDYVIGYFIHSKTIFKYIGEKKAGKAERYIRKYGDLTIFLFNLFPLSSPVVSLTAGIIKYPFKKVFFYSLAGLVLKYLAIMLFVKYLW